MATIACKVLSATVNEKGTATIVMEFNDGVGKWQKTYVYNQTEPIDFTGFKNMIISDLKKDLNVKDQLSNLSAQVGKSFNITI